MEEYQTPGIRFSKASLVESERALEALTELSKSSLLATIIETLNKEANCYLVGGIVRDTFLGVKKSDVDLASQLPAETAQRLLEDAGFHVIGTGIEHGTLTIVSEQKNLELTTFRKPSARRETSYSDTIEEDLSGRDFTINAIAFCPRTKSIIDPYNGIEDLKNNILKPVGNPEERIKEDPLRILRALRFGSASGREIDNKLQKAIKKNISLLKDISIERIRDEFTKILCCDCASSALEVMKEIGFFDLYLPEIKPSMGFEQNEFHIHDVYEHTLWVLDRAPKNPLLRLSALFHDLGKPHTLSVGDDGRRHFYKHEQVSETIAKEVMKRLRYSKEMTKNVATLVKQHMRPIDCGPAGTRRLLRDLSNVFEEWLQFKRADMPPVMTDEEFKDLYDNFMEMVDTEKKKSILPEYGVLAVNGNDLIKIGIPAGKKLGKILKDLEEIVIEEPQKNLKELLLQEAKKLAEES